MQQLPGLRFARSLGSGHEGGFGLKPSADRHGLFLVFEQAEQALACVQQSATVQRYREATRELCVLRLMTTSSRGSWGGVALAPPVAMPPGTAAGVAACADAPLVALTRAAIHPLRAAAFWRHAPASQAGLTQTPGCRLAVGLGEAPLLRQCTVSLWDSVAAMDAYARSGAHLGAIAAARREGYFSEAMFSRFTPLSVQGRWCGRSYALGVAA